MDGNMNGNMDGNMDDNMDGNMDDNMNGNMNGNMSNNHLTTLASPPPLWFVSSPLWISLACEGVLLIMCSMLLSLVMAVRCR